MKSFITAGLMAGIVALSSFTAARAQTGPTTGSPAQPQQPQIQIAGSDWSGSESLGGYGQLRFQFQQGGKVVMIDKDGNTPGKYVQNGPKVSLAFYNDSVLYTGTINGNVLSGSAQNGAKTWTFQVTRQGGVPAPAVAPSPVPAPVAVPAPVPAPVVPSPAPATGPTSTGPASNGPGTTGPTSAAPGSVRLTPENLPDYLRKMGYDLKVITPATGPSYCVLTTKNDAGWTFVVEARAINGGVWLTAPLTQIPSGVANQALLRLLEANEGTSPCFFAYRAADSRICLKLEVIGTNPNNFRGDLNMLCTRIQQTYQLWNAANLGVNPPVAAKN